MAKRTKHRFKFKTWQKVLLWIAGSIIGLVVAVYIAFQVSPWPSALLIRWAFDQNAKERVAALQKYIPTDVSEQLNQQYRAGDRDAYLDVYYPSAAGANDKLPTIVWVHGGGWISGDKKDVAPYLKILASKGYTVIGINYSIAPEKQYPTPVIQTNEALDYIQNQATAFHVDTNQIFLAGDSAGSHIAAQIAAITTNPQYAEVMKQQPALRAEQLAGMLLNCGAYDLALVNAQGDTEGAKLLRTFLWAYSGDKNFMQDPDLANASVIDHVTASFPPTFITAGNDDPLLPQSVAFAQKLQALGVQVDSLFYARDFSPGLQHEYQFDLSTQSGQEALQRMEAFVTAHKK